jgi:selenocysteine lyase/cysteine desulfurase
MLSSQRRFFSLPSNSIYLNGAYMSPMLKSVEKVGIDALRRKRNPATITPQDFFTDTELLRKEYARLINVTDSKRIVVIPSVSYGMATVAKNVTLTKGDHILVVSEQFPSNYYPWQVLCREHGAEVKIISPPSTKEGRGKLWNQRILEAINKQTRMIAIGNIHWADGTVFDLVAIRQRTRDVGALLVVDGTQSVGAMPFDVQRIQPDALVCGGYKWLLGPYSLGLGYYGEYFDGGKPIEENWINRNKSEDFAGLVNYQDDYQPGALRYEVGEHSNFILLPMLMKAIQQLNKWGPENIQAYCQGITKKCIEQLRNRGFWVEEEAYRASHLFGLRLPEHSTLQQVKDVLQKKKILVSYRGDAIRISPNVYNTKDDFTKLTNVLLTLL